MTLSPLLKFSLEALEEAVRQYAQITEKGRKFSILHCDQSIEFILKEKLRSLGVSIFLRNGRTVDFHDALNTLVNKGVKIPELADLELIHEQRNVIQHKGGVVSENEAEFYVKKGFDFIKRFLKEESNLELENYLEKKYYDILEQSQRPDKLLEGMIEREESKNIISLVLLHYRDLEILTRRALMKMGRDDEFLPLSNPCGYYKKKVSESRTQRES